MTRLRNACAAVLAGIGLAASGVCASGQLTSAVEVIKTDRVGQVVASDEKLITEGLVDPVVRPELTADARKLQPEIRERIRRFEIVREAYLKEQEELRKRLRGAATEAERDRVRELIRQAHQEWVERSRQLREDTLRRIRELPAAMPDMREVISNARENARDAAAQGRKRRGQE